MKRSLKKKDIPDAAKTLNKLRDLCLSLPETSERGSWGHPNFVAGKKTFVTFEFIDLRPSIAFRTDPLDVREMARNRRFFETPYGRGQWVSLWADIELDWRFVNELVKRSYRSVALQRMIAKLKT
ncbi:MAG TPA: MmcQ/YjbR family DNA-binding protein [Candidatus Acidoferrales bacterium]|jgi:predicted DNA-binding protein (MmcQ/YjbR family)